MVTLFDPVILEPALIVTIAVSVQLLCADNRPAVLIAEIVPVVAAVSVTSAPLTVPLTVTAADCVPLVDAVNTEVSESLRVEVAFKDTVAVASTVVEASTVMDSAPIDKLPVTAELPVNRTTSSPAIPSNCSATPSLSVATPEALIRVTPLRSMWRSSALTDPLMTIGSVDTITLFNRATVPLRL